MIEKRYVSKVAAKQIPYKVTNSSPSLAIRWSSPGELAEPPLPSPSPKLPSNRQQAAKRCRAYLAPAASYHDVQVEIVRFSTDNDSIGEVLCKRAQALNACAVVMASHNKVRCLWVSA